jgi:hypothetical protein
MRPGTLIGALSRACPPRPFWSVVRVQQGLVFWHKASVADEGSDAVACPHDHPG